VIEWENGSGSSVFLCVNGKTRRLLAVIRGIYWSSSRLRLVDWSTRPLAPAGGSFLSIWMIDQ